MKKIIITVTFLAMLLITQGFSSQENKNLRECELIIYPSSKQPIVSGEMYETYIMLCSDSETEPKAFYHPKEGQVFIRELFASVRAERDQAMEEGKELSDLLEEISREKELASSKQFALLQEQFSETRKNSQEYLELAKEDARMTKQLFEVLQAQLSKLSLTEGKPLEEKDVPTDISNHNITNQQ